MKRMSTSKNSGIVSTDDNKTMPDNPPGPDGGRAGWIAVLALWTECFMCIGIVKGLGIMLPTLQYQFVTKTWVIGWIAAWILATSGLIGLFAGLLSRQFGTGVVIMISGSILGGGAIAASLATSTPQLAFCLVLLSGLLYDYTGSYKASFVCIGFVQLIPLIFLVMLRCLRYV